MARFRVGRVDVWTVAMASLSLIAACASVSAQELPLETAIDSIMTAEGLDHGVPALGVSVVADGKVVFQRAYGYADQSTRRAATVATPFNIASLTKPFTSAVAMQLVAEEKIDLQDRVAAYLPSLPPRYDDLTVYQLLTHTSGIARDLRLDNFDDPDADEYRARLDTAGPSAPPGTRFEYSNTGYAVLGWLIEAVEDEHLGQVFERRLFAPLGMHQARYRASLEEDPMRARPHAMRDGSPVPAAYISGGFASGGMSMSTSDASAVGKALQEQRFLPVGFEDEVWSPARLAFGDPVELEMFEEAASYGFGWFLASYDGRRLYTHGGGIEGYSANLYHFPDERLTIVVLANSKQRDDGVAPVDVLARRIADFCLRKNSGRPDTTQSGQRRGIEAGNRAFPERRGD